LPANFAKWPLAHRLQPIRQFSWQGAFQMSFKPQGPGAFASGLIGLVVGIAVVGGAIALLSHPAVASSIARSVAEEPSP
jgi:hypothetical protein